MKLRVGNACWHAHHIFHGAVCNEAGFFAQEGLDVEIMHAKINPEGISSSRPGGEPYEEVGTVLRDMVRFGIDIVTDIHLHTPFAERSLGNDELRIIGAWRNQFPYCLMAGPGIKSISELRGKRIGVWYIGADYWHWHRVQLRRAGLDPDRDVEWVVGYRYGSAREAWKPLRAGETDAAIVQNPWVPLLSEEGFTKLVDFIELHKPHGRPERVTVARKTFLERNPELIKRYWKAAIRGYQFMRIVPENFPFQRYVEAKLRMGNPDEHERMRDLRGDRSKEGLRLMEESFFPLNGQLSPEGVRLLLDEYKEGKILPESVGTKDIEEVVRQELAVEAWREVSQTDEVKQNLERLQPVIERLGY